MKTLRAVALLLAAAALVAPAWSAINDAACVKSLADAVMGYDCGYWDDAAAYTCPGNTCKEALLLVAQVCLAESYRLADQVVAAAKAIEAEGGSVMGDSSSWANATANNV